MAHPTAHEVQEGIGQTGRFGEIVVGLALVIGIAGGVILYLGQTGEFSDSIQGAPAARSDAYILGFFLIVEGLGFGVFGAMIILAGWARHHKEFEF